MVTTSLFSRKYPTTLARNLACLRSSMQMQKKFTDERQAGRFRITGNDICFDGEQIVRARIGNQVSVEDLMDHLHAREEEGLKLEDLLLLDTGAVDLDRTYKIVNPDSLIPVSSENGIVELIDCKSKSEVNGSELVALAKVLQTANEQLLDGVMYQSTCNTIYLGRQDEFLSTIRDVVKGLIMEDRPGESDYPFSIMSDCGKTHHFIFIPEGADNYDVKVEVKVSATGPSGKSLQIKVGKADQAKKTTFDIQYSGSDSDIVYFVDNQSRSQKVDIDSALDMILK